MVSQFEIFEPRRHKGTVPIAIGIHKDWVLPALCYSVSLCLCGSNQPITHPAIARKNPVARVNDLRFGGLSRHALFADPGALTTAFALVE